jgi:hypothetical protein
MLDFEFRNPEPGIRSPKFRIRNLGVYETLNLSKYLTFICHRSYTGYAFYRSYRTEGK